MKSIYDYTPVNAEQKVLLEKFNADFAEMDANIRTDVPSGIYSQTNRLESLPRACFQKFLVRSFRITFYLVWGKLLNSPIRNTFLEPRFENFLFILHSLHSFLLIPFYDSGASAQTRARARLFKWVLL
jgi:hypothetical protein